MRGASHKHQGCYEALARLELIQGNYAQAEQWAILYHGGKQKKAYGWLSSFDFLPYEKAVYYRKLGHKASRLRLQDVQEIEGFAQVKEKRSVYEKLAQKDAEIGDYVGAEGKLRQSYRDKYGEEDGASVFFALGKFLKNKNQG